MLEWAGAALNRVDRTVFFGQFDEGHAVQYFYEPFLEAFDPELRKELGVWYTPPEIVQYMVARVDTVLKEELDIKGRPGGPGMFTCLIPAARTGAYLRRCSNTSPEPCRKEVRRSSRRGPQTRGHGARLWIRDHARAVRDCSSSTGAPVREYGAPFSEEKGERPGVYLTNALTGWEPPEGPKRDLPFPSWKKSEMPPSTWKRDVPILVILENPPYNAFAGLSPPRKNKIW